MQRAHRPLRTGLWLVVLGLLGLGLARYLQTRRPAAPADNGWTPLEPREPERRPPPPMPIVDPTIVEIGDVDGPGEPEVGTVLDAAPPATKKAPAKKAAAKKAAAKKVAGVKKAAAKKVAGVKKAAAKKAPAKKAPATKAAPPPPPPPQPPE